MSSTKSYTPLDEISQFSKKMFTISATGRAFVNNDPNSLTYGNIPLKQYLEENGETGTFIMIKTLQNKINLFDLQRFYHSPLEGESARQERSSQSSR